ncbi:MAG: PH domain-containing protein [Acidobacteria bacterium]|nr:PH domain-containing protein [Acidobacteriota bacterium]MBV9474909.1 PH domain-containing protein [Acidobacteriota bacterium]
MNWRPPVLRLMRVPHEPTPPPGSPPRVFRAAPNFLALRAFEFGLKQLVAIIGLTFAVMFSVLTLDRFDPPRWVLLIIHLGEVVAGLAIVGEIFLGWMLVRLDYELRWYMLSDRAIRIREGITTVREKTVALANIQNISIKQGPLQRFLKIADVEVNTAGGGGSSARQPGKKQVAEPMHVAYFRGVDNAEQIRDLLLEGVRRQKDAGLGDPDDAHHAPAVVAPVAEVDDVNAAVAELLAASRALRIAASMPQAAWRAAPPE